MSAFRIAGNVALTTCLVLFPDFVMAQSDANGDATGTATLRVRLSYKGDPPAAAFLDGKSDSFCKHCMIPDERLLVSRDGELQNVLLIWDERKNKDNFPKSFAPPAAEKVEMKFESCRLQPHIVVVRVGQEFVVTSSDKTGHNSELGLINNEPLGLLIPAGQPMSYVLRKPEIAVIPIQCGTHSWERAYMVVKEHPLVGLSDEHGLIEIKGLPIGKSSFRIWHESLVKEFDRFRWNGAETQSPRGYVAFDLKPGLNDLGVIELDEKQFSLVHEAGSK